MNKNERFSEIIEILNHTPYTTIERLAEELHISTSSIRRDVTTLEARGLVRRTHGGVSLMVSDNLNIPFSMRAKANVAEKKGIAKKAAALVREGDVVFLDTSSTDLYIAHELVKKRGITVVTGSVAILAFLSEFNTKVLCTGGILDPEDRNGLVGNEALRRISRYAPTSPLSHRRPLIRTATSLIAITRILPLPARCWQAPSKRWAFVTAQSSARCPPTSSAPSEIWTL